MLQIIHPIEECPETLAFATEPVFASLTNILAFQVSCVVSQTRNRVDSNKEKKTTEIQSQLNINF